GEGGGMGGGGGGRRRRQRVGVDVRRPQAAEADEIPVSPVHAGDAVIFVPPRAVGGGDLLRDRLVLARPGNDAPGVVGVIDVNLRAGGSAQQQNADQGQERPAQHSRLPFRQSLVTASGAAKAAGRGNRQSVATKPQSLLSWIASRPIP